ncbi:phage regulatory CII family protein [Kiritimatiella glycovorans]|uniref:Uncharacterized protein n=1 Tax=Kiritimatiella glycovorans TaxID=1307763 RepID=A0A0G3EB07_9BACT|nr:phage regulatory CII family protein [Kiritimatiella glycovorans]AKJ63458.1 hypothetical protein L21SP4_00174 [Kiritimatiella glycovorans]
MESHEIFREAMNRTGIKTIAGHLRLSTSLLYKWCQPSDTPDASGAANPLDRVRHFCAFTGDASPVMWLCEQCGGYFVRNPDPGEAPPDLMMLDETRRIVREFSQLFDAITKSLDEDGTVSPCEAERIRREWEDLKRVGEGFVRACEAKKSPSTGEN